MSRSLTRTSHLRLPPGHARHSRGSSRTPAESLAGHAPGRGARLTQVQPEQGGSRALAQTEPGGTS